MNTDTQKKMQEVFSLQYMTQGIHAVVLENLKLMPLVCYPHASECEITISDEQILVNLIPKKGIKGFVSKFKYRKNEKMYENNLRQSYNYFLQGLKNKPNLVIKWKNS